MPSYKKQEAILLGSVCKHIETKPLQKGTGNREQGTGTGNGERDGSFREQGEQGLFGEKYPHTASRTAEVI
ncbi:MAG: hypothetical protein AB4426_15875 [Xenococcaceae cyanobacterium]